MRDNIEKSRTEMDDMNKNGDGQGEIKIWNQSGRNDRNGNRKNVYVVVTDNQDGAGTSDTETKSYMESESSEKSGEPAPVKLDIPDDLPDPIEQDIQTDPIEKQSGSEPIRIWNGNARKKDTSGKREKKEQPVITDAASGTQEANPADVPEKTSVQETDSAEQKGGLKGIFESKKNSKPDPSADENPEKTEKSKKRKKRKSDKTDLQNERSAGKNRNKNPESKKENLLGRDNLSKTERRSIWKKNSLDGTPRESIFSKGKAFLKTYGIRIIAVIAVFAVVIGASLLYNRNRTYHKYDVRWQISASSGSATRYELFDDRILCYSQNGVSCIDKTNGETLWNSTYDMDAPVAVISGKYVLVYDMKGTGIYIFNADGCTGKAETTKSILKADISESGVVAVVLDDTNCNYINYYDKDGLLIDIEIKTLISGDGYPMDIAISPDATELMTSYIYSESGSMLNQVVFRNFEVGKNASDRVVGGFKDYAETLVPDVLFFDDQHAAAITENSIDFYSTRNAKKPELSTTKKINTEIESIFYNDSYIGVITAQESSQNETVEETGGTVTDLNETTAETEATSSDGYNLTVYDKSGGKVFKTKINFNYTSAAFSADGIVIYNDSQCAVYNMTGVCKYKTDSDMENIEGLLRIDETTLVLYGSDALRLLKLK